MTTLADEILPGFRLAENGGHLSINFYGRASGKAVVTSLDGSELGRFEAVSINDAETRGLSLLGRQFEGGFPFNCPAIPIKLADHTVYGELSVVGHLTSSGVRALPLAPPAA